MLQAQIAPNENADDEVLEVPDMERAHVVFQALGARSRREILEFLQVMPATNGHLAATLEMSASLVSHHLQVLERAGLVRAGGPKVFVLTELAQRLLKAAS
jgi:DNA-binding transcriptional ArsR family regulator